jgi:hypothetical protein
MKSDKTLDFWRFGVKKWGPNGPFRALFAGFCSKTGQKPTCFGHFLQKTLYFTRFSVPGFCADFFVLKLQKWPKPWYFEHF